MKRSRQALVGSNREVGAEYRLRQSEEDMRQLAMRLQATREEERKTLARELHDELGQMLTAIKLELARAVASLRRDQVSRSSVDRLQALIGLAEIGIATVKRIATDLRPATLDHLGLAAAIEWEATAFRARTGLRCRVVGAKEITTLSPEQETVLFRIFQESLTNVVRHAQASAVHVRLSEQAGVFEMTVHDNGRGISNRQAHNTAAIGLLGMRERATLIGGTFIIAGTPGRGTVVEVTVASKASVAATVCTGKEERHAMIRILLVDDHPVVRQGIRTILDGALKRCGRRRSPRR